MAEMTAELADDPELAAAYGRAHEDYLARRAALGDGPGDRRGSRPAGCRRGSSACTCWSGTPWRPGPGVNPFGDKASRCWTPGGPWWEPPCRTTRESR